LAAPPPVFEAALGDDLPDDLLARIKAELEPGERVLWAAKSLGPHRESGSPWGCLGWSLFFLAVSASAFFLTYGPPRSRVREIEGFLLSAGLLAGIVGISFVAVTMVSWVSNLRRSWTTKPPWHALTDRRAIVWESQVGSAGIAVHAYARGTVKGIHRIEFPDGTGDVIFSTSQIPAYEIQCGFLRIPEVIRVEGLTRDYLLDIASAENRRSDRIDVTSNELRPGDR
jgi:hypothetical protein